MKKLAFSILKKVKSFLSNRGFDKLPGATSIYFFLYELVKPKGIVLTEGILGGHKMYIDTRDIGIGHALLMHGVYDEFETIVFRKLLKEGMVVLDIGGNIGFVTLMAAHLVGKSGRVFAFEPEPNNYALLVKNIEINGYDKIAIPVQKAVSNKTGKTKLFIPSDDMADCEIYDSRQGKKSIEVEVITLNDFFKDYNEKVDIIKMDIQGSEMSALEGMDNIISKNENLVIITEFAPHRLKKFGFSPEKFLNKLNEYGFAIYNINEEKKSLQKLKCFTSLIEMYNNNNLSTNLLCVRKMNEDINNLLNEYS